MLHSQPLTEFTPFRNVLISNGVRPDILKDDLAEYYNYKVSYYNLIKDTLTKTEQLQYQERLSYLSGLLGLVKCACLV
jgi:hypothetical protein